MLDIVFGKKTNPQAVTALVETLSSANLTGTLYIGYPVLGGDDSSAVTDALLTCEEHGLVIFDLASGSIPDQDARDIADNAEYRQKYLRRRLNARLVSYEDLIDPDELILAFPIKVITFTPDDEHESRNGVEFASPKTLLAKISKFRPLPREYIRPLNAAIQKTAALKPKKRRLNVKRNDSMGAAIKFIESQIANLDKWQKNAAIESPEGPQRIRGLAGSGKTIILAMKAAYLHANDPSADIVVTFNTRSLYQQFQNLIRKFYFDQAQDEPDWDKLQIMHAWGSEVDAGVYSTVTSAAGISPLSFGAARNKFGYNEAFKGVCAEALNLIRKVPNFKPLFDYVLIDEAQDFPPSFFQLVHYATRKPKRIVWAYDELQNLNDSSMPSLDELFGVNDEGVPLVEIQNIEGAPKEDILLPVCYRNPSWILTTALGLGLGIKKDDGEPIQMFSQPEFWEEIGYQSSSPIDFGRKVKLARNPDRSAQFFADVLTPQESIRCHCFADSESQANWVAKDIDRALRHQELDVNDIMVVIPNTLDAPQIFKSLYNSLKSLGYKSHLVGVTGSRDVVFVEDSIAVCSIYRAKGNEAPLVYVINSEYCVIGASSAKRRNMLFTAMTRAKAWVRVCGVGASMKELESEINSLMADDGMLCFKYPTQEKIKKMKSAYRERTTRERRTLTKELNEAKRLLQRLSSGEVDIEELPPDFAELLRKLSK